MKIVARLLVLLPLLWVEGVWAVDCPSEDYGLNSQAEVDALGATGCDRVSGNLYIRNSTDITNLDGLANLTSVGDYLLIYDNAALTNLDGLANLTSVGGYLVIGSNSALTNLDGLTNITSVGGFLSIGYNAALTNLDGLAKITSVGGFLSITGNAALTNLDGLAKITSVGGFLWIENNSALTNLDGLANLTSVGGFLVILQNALLTNLNGLASLTSVGGYLVIHQNALLTNLNGLASLTSVGGYLDIRNNFALTNIDGLASLTSVGDYLYIGSNSALTNLDGLASLTSVGDYLYIGSNSALTNLDGLASLNSVGGYLYIGSNSALTNLDGLANLTSVGDYLLIYDNAALTNLDGLANLTSVGGYLVIRNNFALTNLDGLANLTSVGGFLSIGYNAALTNLDGLAKITSVGGILWIENNDALTNLDGLAKITSVGDYLYIGSNSALTNLDGLASLNSVGGFLSIYDNAALTNLDGLAKITSVGDYLYIGSNSALTNLDGLASLNSVRDDLRIYDNAALTNCGALARVLGSPNGPPDDAVGGDIYIRDNGAGCNSVDEILAGALPSAPIIALQSKTYSSAVISISPNEEGAAPITSYTTTCEAPTASRLARSTNRPTTYALGELTAFKKSRLGGNGASVSIGQIYRPNPDLARASEGDSLQFRLPSGGLIEAEIVTAERTRHGNYLLRAKRGEDEILAVVNSDGEFVSSVKTASDRFQSHILEGETVVYSQNSGEFADSPFDMDSLLPSLPIDPSLAGSSTQNLTSAQTSSGTVEISVGIQYDNATKNAYDEIAEAEFAIAYANQAYQNSDVDISFNIVGIRNYEGYVSSQDMAETLYYVTFGTIDPQEWSFNQNVKAWRDQVKADLIVQIVRYGVAAQSGGTTCGIAWTPNSDTLFGSFYLPFVTHSVNALETPSGYACGDVVVAHEMGHNFGLNHDRATSPDANPYYSYARGYKNSSFGTVMSYTSNYIPYLSNPNKTYNGRAVGVAIGQSGEAHSAQAVSNKMRLHEAIYDNPPSTQGETWVEITTTNKVEFTDLPASTQISCSTVATSSVGNSDASNTLIFATNGPPTVPSNVVITGSDYGDEEVYLYVSVNNGGDAITKYEATCTDGTNTFTGTSTSSPITVSGLTNGVAYTCTVTATNSVGTSSASAATDPITPEEGSTGLPIWLLYQATQ